MHFIMWISVTFTLGSLIYYGVCRIIMMWCGCTLHEARVKIRSFLTDNYEYDISEDNSFINDVWLNVKNIIGKQRFAQLISISQAALYTPLLYGGRNCGMRYVAISMYINDDNEKQILQTVLHNVAVNYLKANCFTDEILIEWKYRDDLKMSVLQISYAATDKEQQMLIMAKQTICNNIIAKNTDVIDTDDNEDLNGNE